MPRDYAEEAKIIEEARLAQLYTRVVDHSIGRRILCHDHGTWYWTIDEATYFLISLTAALERALDPTPLPPDPEPERIPSPVPKSKTTNIEDLA